MTAQPEPGRALDRALDGFAWYAETTQDAELATAARADLAAMREVLREARDRLIHQDWCAAYDSNEISRCEGLNADLIARIDTLTPPDPENAR